MKDKDIRLLIIAAVLFVLGLLTGLWCFSGAGLGLALGWFIILLIEGEDR